MLRLTGSLRLRASSKTLRIPDDSMCRIRSAIQRSATCLSFDMPSPLPIGRELSYAHPIYFRQAEKRVPVTSTRDRTGACRTPREKVNQGPDEVQKEDHQKPQNLVVRRWLIRHRVDEHPQPENRGRQGQTPDDDHEHGSAAKNRASRNVILSKQYKGVHVCPPLLHQ